MLGFVVFLILGVIGVIFGYYLRKVAGVLSKYQIVKSIKDITPGTPMVVKGTVTANQPLTSPLTQRQCVYYDYRLERQVHTRNNDGTTTTRWQLVGDPDVQRVPFILKDASGLLHIDPKNAEFHELVSTTKLIKPQGVGATTSQNQATEYIIPMNTSVYAYGTVTTQKDELTMQQAKGSLFIISPKGKDALMRSEVWKEYLCYGLGILFLMLSVYELTKHVL